MSNSISMGRPPFLPPNLNEPAQPKKPQEAQVSSSKRMPVVDRSKVDPSIVQAAEGMEAMFIDYLMKTMRETIPSNDMDLESPASKIYRGMLDSEYAEKAAHHHPGGVGLADQIIAYLNPQGYNQRQGQAVPTKEKP